MPEGPPTSETECREPGDESSRTFTLHPQLAADTCVVGDLALSRLLVMNDSRFPWLILVPRRTRVIELVDLEAPDRAALVEEIAQGSEALRRVAAPDKLNLGALGNRVAQLHIHLVGRFRGDEAWPDPVWGRGSPKPYAEGAGERFATAIAAALGLG